MCQFLVCFAEVDVTKLLERAAAATTAESGLYKAADIIAMLDAAGLAVGRESGILGVCSTLL